MLSSVRYTYYLLCTSYCELLYTLANISQNPAQTVHIFNFKNIHKPIVLFPIFLLCILLFIFMFLDLTAVHSLSCLSFLIMPTQMWNLLSSEPDSDSCWICKMLKKKIYIYIFVSVRKKVDVLSSHRSLFNFYWTCVFQFVFDRRGFHPGHWSSARPMGGRQGDPASHCGKLVFACVTMTLSALCVFWEALALHPHPWEEVVRQARERCWERPHLSPSLRHSSTTNINTTLGGRFSLYEPTPSLNSVPSLPAMCFHGYRDK